MGICLVIIFVLISLYLFKRLYLEDIPIDNIVGKTVLITGCDTGFGRNIALRCVRNGMYVYAGFKTKEGMDGLKKDAEGAQGVLLGILLDIKSDESVSKAKEFVESDLKKKGKELFAIINNAGVCGPPMVDDFTTINDYLNVFEINTLGTIRMTHAFKDLLKKSRGRIVIMTSVLSRVAMPGFGPYVVSKFGLCGYCDLIRRELAPFGITVSVLEPGFFSTAINAPHIFGEAVNKIWNSASETIKRQYGTAYHIGYKRALTGFVSKASKDLGWVDDLFFHALIAKYPRTRYQVGYDAIFGFIPLSILPAPIQDVFLTLFGIIIGMPKPAGAV